MSRRDPAPGCFDVAFARPYPLSEAAEMALEDYARALAAAAAAETVTDAEAVTGVHVCGAADTTAPVAREIEGFARDLFERAGGGGLGWE